MNRTRFSFPFLLPQDWGLGGLLLAATLLSTPAVRAQTYSVTVTDLTPPDPNNFNEAVGYGISGSQQAGYVLFYPANGDVSGTHQDAVLWTGSVASLVDLAPAGYAYSQATGVSGNTQVGYGATGISNNYPAHALLWHGTADSVVDLTPAGFIYAKANGVSGNTQVGIGGTTSANDALLWTGTAASAVNLNPTNLSGFVGSEALGVSGSTQVGKGDYHDNNIGILHHALLWHGTADSAVDLNPAGFTEAQATAASGSQQVGYGYGPVTGSTVGSAVDKALLWTGTAASAIVLDPPQWPQLSSYYQPNESFALGISGGVQVGDAVDVVGFYHAALWRGTGAIAIDLDPYLPANYQNGSIAYSVEAHGNVADVVGAGTNSYDSDNPISHAFLWHIVFQDKSTVTHLYPASRTAGEKGFVLTVSGTGFTPETYATFNGVKTKTYFGDSFTLTVPIRATAITQPGTAQIAVFTPGAGTSNSHALTIMPRPAVTSLSPKSKPAGSAAFTLTVTGTGFRPASFYAPTIVKWNSTELATAYVSATQLTAQVPTSLLTKSGKVLVTVTTPQVATSAGKTFTITP